MFGVFSVNESLVAFQYIFAICNSLQVDTLVYEGSYMSVHVLLNLLNELRERDKMRGLPSILSLFYNKFNQFINTDAQMLNSIYHYYDIKIILKLYFAVKTLEFAICLTLKASFYSHYL